MLIRNYSQFLDFWGKQYQKIDADLIALREGSLLIELLDTEV
jgi:hypothetical protein